MPQRALITGIAGQDGAYLAKFLLAKGYEVYGTYESDYAPNLWRLTELGIVDHIQMQQLDLRSERSCKKLLFDVRADEMYNLETQSYISVSFEKPVATGEITGLGVVRLLEAVRAVDPSIAFFQASSSEMFGKALEVPQTENTRFYPRSPYAIAKLYAHWTVVNYREVYDLCACSGILFNHESPLREQEFVTRKISVSVAKVKQGLQEKLLLGNINVRMDWGYAPEYVEAMWLMLQQRPVDDYVIATGRAHSVRDFVSAAFRVVDMELVWEGQREDEKGIEKKTGRVLVEIDSRLFRPSDSSVFVGDASKAREKLGWDPRTSFEDLVEIMVQEDLRRIKFGSIDASLTPSPALNL